MIELRAVTKQYGTKVAVRDLTFTVEPGLVTGLLGPNGAGKSTTMRMIVGLDSPTSGQVLVAGHAFRTDPTPMRTLGALLDPAAAHPGRTGRGHLQGLARTNGIPASRIDDVLGVVGMTAAAGQRISTYSLGMRQRLGIAAALLGDPGVLVLDEPVNGLDPDGVHWVRQLLRALAAEGRTVLVSSHLMSEMALTAHQVIVMGTGALVASGPIDSVIQRATRESVLVSTPSPRELEEVLTSQGARVSTEPDGALRVHDLTAAQIGDTALAARIAVHELVTQHASLEEAFLELTKNDQEFAAGQPVGDAR